MGDKYDEMPIEQVERQLDSVYGFKKDEIDVLFPSEAERREALRSFDLLALSSDSADALPDGFAEDKTTLTSEQKAEVEERREARKKYKKAVEEQAKEESVAEAAEMAEEANLPITKEDLKKAMEALNDDDLFRNTD